MSTRVILVRFTLAALIFMLGAFRPTVFCTHVYQITTLGTQNIGSVSVITTCVAYTVLTLATSIFYR